MKNLTPKNIHSAIEKVNREGFATIDLSEDISPDLGVNLYEIMNNKEFHPSRAHYYNEIAFYWPDDWKDVSEGIGSFHEQKSLKQILPFPQAKHLLLSHFGGEITQAIVDFVSQVKNLVVSQHHGLSNNELRLSRVMIRQLNENDHTLHGGSDCHEDQGYSNRPYQQLLSAVITTHGIPTAAGRYEAKVGELLIFNAFDRRRILGLCDDLAFVHSGPKTGPKMFFFFEFLGPS